MNSKYVFIVLLLSVIFQSQVLSKTKADELMEKNSTVSIWSDLTDFELVALQRLSKSQEADADTLLMLYLLASGNSRTFSGYNKTLKTIDDFINKIADKVNNEPSEWRKGYLLHQAMHKHFFIQAKKTSVRSSGYDFDQTQLSEIFRSKKFNCISSSLLFVILAKKFNWNVKGVLLPSHAFVQMTLTNGKIIEIETTSITGFDWVHDKIFYQSKNNRWFKERGLAPSTLQQYQKRQILTPFKLGLSNMTNQHIAKKRMSSKDRSRQYELLSTLQPNNLNAIKSRLYFYNNEFVALDKRKNYKKLSNLYKKIQLFLDSLVVQTFEDKEIYNMLAWISVQKSLSAFNNSAEEKALGLAQDTIKLLAKDIKDREKITKNLFFILNSVSKNRVDNLQFEAALAVYQGDHLKCLINNLCESSIGYIFSKWASFYWKKKQWKDVIEKYRTFLSLTTTGKIAELFKSNMQKAYINWANRYGNNGDWLQMNDILKLCVEYNPKATICRSELSDLQHRHQLD